MKKWEKEILEKQIKDEKAAISRLKKTYQDVYKRQDIPGIYVKIEEL